MHVLLKYNTELKMPAIASIHSTAVKHQLWKENHLEQISVIYTSNGSSYIVLYLFFNSIYFQVLQTFHHTKAYKGSPVKATKLQDIREKTSLVYDPRTGQDEQLKSRTQNLCVNYRVRLFICCKFKKNT